MQGQAPSAEFLASLSSELSVNASWLLTGQGPVYQAEIRPAALAEADVPELLTALSNTLTALIERVERLERFVQSIEAHVRSGNGSGTDPGATVAIKSGVGGGSNDGSERTDASRGRAERIAGAVAKRSHKDADRSD